MADRWMDERDRRWREREGRRTDAYSRGEEWRDDDYGFAEDRSFDREDYAARRSGPERDRVFGEEDSGAGYNRPDFRTRGYGGHKHGAEWQERDYGGVSPAMAHGEYEADHNRRHPRFSSQDYTRGGGRFYGDDDRTPIYREEYGQGGVEYGRVPRGYDAGRTGAPRARPAYGGTASGGTGGYDYERGYGDGGRRDQGRHDYEGRAEQYGREAGDFLRRAGQRVRGWFRGDDLMDAPAASYRTDFGRERRYVEDRGHRGLGPKGYKRSDERIAEEVNQRLTDDEWLDASNIDVAVAAGEVTLTGTVENREAKHRAERIVEDVSGVDHVQNNLRPGAGNPLTTAGRGYGDSALEAQMRRDGNGDGTDH